MKYPLLAIFVFLVLNSGELRAQGPTLNLVGSSPTFSKGNINTEILTQIIQEKQEEVKRKVFRNTVIEGFNDASFSKNLKNFATYHYLYNVMDVMTSGKNKTVMTKAIVESSTEFAYVFGLAWYVTHVKDQMTFGPTTIDASIFKEAQPTFEGGKLKPGNTKSFNMVIDICYDVILNDMVLQNRFNFKNDLSDNNFETWYTSDNCYVLASNAFKLLITDFQENESEVGVLEQFDLIDTKIIKGYTDDQRKNYLIAQQKSLSDLRDGIKNHLDNLEKLAGALETTTEELKALKNAIQDKGVDKTVDDLLSSLSELSASQIRAKIEKINTDYVAILTNDQQTKITKIAGLIDQNYDQFNQLIQFYVGLKKSDYKDFTLSKDQYYALKYLLLEFLNFAKNQFDNHVAASVLEFLIENTIVEYMDPDDHSKAEKDADAKDKGYLYIDVESLIAAVDQYYNPSTRKSSVASKLWFMNPRPFLSIGTNYANFLNSNTLSTNESGAAESLDNFYFASEKIGFKIKFFDKRYARSFKPGEKFRYKGTERVWFRPQKIATVSDVHLIVYASGLLYNIIDIKSNKNFNYAVAGAGLGITFFNGLSANGGLGCPFTDKKFHADNMYFNLGFDVPIIEYISALNKKN